MAKHHRTLEGTSTLQDIHDMTSKAGAVCDDPNDPLVKQRAASVKVIVDKARSEGVPDIAYYAAEFLAKKEAKLLQEIHNFTKQGGAKCNSISGFSDSRDGTLAQQELARYIEAMGKSTDVVNEQKIDFRITDANRGEVLMNTRLSAVSYAASRNRRGTIPKSRVGETAREKEIRLGVEDWLNRKRRAVN